MSVEPRFFTTSILPVRESLVLRGGRGVRVPLRVRVGYLDHPTLGPMLIDTGYGPGLDRPDPGRSWLLAAYCAALRPTTLGPRPLADGLARMGVRPEDIRTVLLTHLHPDHVGGLAEVPQARLLCPAAALAAMRGRGAVRNAMEAVFPELLPPDFDHRVRVFDDAPRIPAPGGLGTGWDVAGDGSVLVVDLPGHAPGHVGLCFPQLDPPLVYSTDAQWLIRAIVEDRAPGPPASMTAHDRAAARATGQVLRGFVAAGGDLVLCHDPEIHRLDVDGEVGA